MNYIAHNQAGDIFRFYEINPAVVDILEGPYFSYLDDSPAQLEIVLGDERISVEEKHRQNESQLLDFLV